MCTSIVENIKIGSVTYRIVLLDDKYTVYVSTDKEEVNNEKEDVIGSEFSAVASFDSLGEAKAYVDSKDPNKNK